MPVTSGTVAGYRQVKTHLHCCKPAKTSESPYLKSEGSPVRSWPWPPSMQSDWLAAAPLPNDQPPSQHRSGVPRQEATGQRCGGAAGQRGRRDGRRRRTSASCVMVELGFLHLEVCPGYELRPYLVTESGSLLSAMSWADGSGEEGGLADREGSKVPRAVNDAEACSKAAERSCWCREASFPSCEYRPWYSTTKPSAGMQMSTSTNASHGARRTAHGARRPDASRLHWTGNVVVAMWSHPAWSHVDSSRTCGRKQALTGTVRIVGTVQCRSGLSYTQAVVGSIPIAPTLLTGWER